jgi:hypothetical protein
MTLKVLWTSNNKITLAETLPTPIRQILTLFHLFLADNLGLTQLCSNKLGMTQWWFRIRADCISKKLVQNLRTTHTTQFLIMNIFLHRQKHQIITTNKKCNMFRVTKVSQKLRNYSHKFKISLTRAKRQLNCQSNQFRSISIG